MTDLSMTGGMRPIRFKFNERKATAMAALLLNSESGEMPYIRLIKLMYLAERACLAQFNRPICGDLYFSMTYGPVLSHVLNLIKGEEAGAGEWTSHIERSTDYNVRLFADPGTGPLSQAETRILTDVSSIYRELDRWHLAELTHMLPEWKDPGESSHQIAPESILAALRKSDEEVEEIRQAANEQSYFDDIFGA